MKNAIVSADTGQWVEWGIVTALICIISVCCLILFRSSQVNPLNQSYDELIVVIEAVLFMTAIISFIFTMGILLQILLRIIFIQ
jgi:hypothetical protein